jgi:glycosyltransferase involved in cell wall biosynthesis
LNLQQIFHHVAVHRDQVVFDSRHFCCAQRGLHANGCNRVGYPAGYTCAPPSFEGRDLIASQSRTSSASRRPRAVVIATSPFAINSFWSEHLSALRAHYDVRVIVNANDPLASGVVVKVPDGVQVVSIDLHREISLVHDFQALRAIRRYLMQERVQLVVSMTPKGGLVGMVCARLARVPVRVHWFTGQVWATRKGVMRHLLQTTDKITAQAATHLLVDSHTQADFLASQSIVARNRLEVLGSGSVSGVDCERFKPDPAARQAMRAELGITDAETVLVFAGRINRDKGIIELIEAYRRLRDRGHAVRLLIVGPDESRLLEGTLPAGVITIGYTRQVERYLLAADIFCLPSHREGFGLVLIEAGACGLPSMASRIYGITDALIDGVTGLLHRPEDADDIFRTAEQLIASSALRERLGAAALTRARTEFASQRVTQLLVARLTALTDAKA